VGYSSSRTIFTRQSTTTVTLVSICKMTLKLQFVQLDVFTAERYSGNPLAIVHLPEERSSLTQAQKQLIAKEFNLSETVFLHETTDPDSPAAIDIFTVNEELPFAGHPTIGTGWYLLSKVPERNAIVLRTKAGDIPVLRDGSCVRLQVPIEFKVHEPYTRPSLKELQVKLKDADYVNSTSGVASIVKGMTFILVQVTSEDALARMQPYPERFQIPDLGEWGAFVGVYAFFERTDGVVRTRMFDGMLEDPATGSAASTLAGWLAQKKGHGRWQFEIVQGVEMGRRSEITVVVEVDGDCVIRSINLGGAAVEVMEGRVQV
jgi:PhzF family phenazine biosynthesis protein